MAPTAEWRRISDWKLSITVVDLADVEPAFLATHGLVPPDERLAERFPSLAALLRKTRFVRVDDSLARLLIQAGVSTYEVGYHRVSDGLQFALENRFDRTVLDFDVAELATKVLAVEGVDDAYGRARSDVVDAVLRIYSEGILTERAIIVAALAPALSLRDPVISGEESLEEFETLDAADLPDVTPEFVDRVASVLSTLKPAPAGPMLTALARRTYQRKAAAVGGVALAAALLGLAYSPFVAVLALPIVILCLITILIHAVVLRQTATR